MTDRGPCSQVELDGRRVVIDLSDADLAQLARITTRRRACAPDLVLDWIRRGLYGEGAWAELSGRSDRMARDVEVARQTDELFGGLLGDCGDSD
ncbi:hypothetical protein [Promicromonospora iranensis]|uniref:Uncharacterized protein n=1 Tax=Promicromonospora iranensis TaxID=1105144 RepID=A0ABU2CKT2_9MICO|nr:hypothetical protein [Promicromonospora iranensis]MDR7381949.1 hypothetical protein [Promicromonospora iranensis]